MNAFVGAIEGASAKPTCDTFAGWLLVGGSLLVGVDISTEYDNQDLLSLGLFYFLEAKNDGGGFRFPLFSKEAAALL